MLNKIKNLFVKKGSKKYYENQISYYEDKIIKLRIKIIKLDNRAIHGATDRRSVKSVKKINILKEEVAKYKEFIKLMEEELNKVK